ncbi:MAG: hypothetical protein LBF00_03370 [Mycoplasmataceae bacterium]|jgi:DNA-directed RNA polymerase specialized sigma24 family protein|nr:hypothetical protein [Mycoplasmataceae bacterium]
MTEKEMIQEYKINNNLSVRDELYYRHKDMLEALTNNLFRQLFNNSFIEKEDFLSLSYLSFVKCLDTFDINQKRYTFTQALATTNRSMLINYAIKYQTLGHRVLNEAINLNTNLYTISYSNEEEIIRNVDQECEIEKIQQFLKPYPIKVKKLFKLKADGYQNKEIATMLKLSTKKVANSFLNICKRYRNYEL